MAQYRFVDQLQRRGTLVEVPSDATVAQVKEALINEGKMMLRRTDDQGNPMNYMLSFEGRFLLPNDRFLAIPPGSTIDITGEDTVMGAGRSETDRVRVYRDHDELMEMAALNPGVFEVKPEGRMRDGIHLCYTLTIRGFAGPMANMDEARANLRSNSADLLHGAGPVRDPITQREMFYDKFKVELRVLEGYPDKEPSYYYNDPLLCHPNVRVDSREACLFKRWDGRLHSLATCARRLAMQISYIGFQPNSFDDPFGAVDLMNRSALVWIKDYLRSHPNGIPFRNRGGANALALKMPATWKATNVPVVPSQGTEVVQLQVGSGA